MRADIFFNSQGRRILNSPDGDDFERKVRARWADGSPAHSQFITHSIVTWDCSDGVPIQTGRPIAWKSALREILALYQKRATTKEEFEENKVKWWTPWFNEEENLGTSYAYQLKKEIDFPEGRFNQVDRVLWLLKNKPHDRRIMTNMFNMEELKDMTLPPCAFMTLWNVGKKKDNNQPQLNLMLIQRSGDFLPAAGFGGINTIQYYFLQAMFAQINGFKMGKFTHIINNLHIYDRHLEDVEELISRKSQEPPILWVNPKIKNFYDFTENDIKLINYKAGEPIKNIPIAE